MKGYEVYIQGHLVAVEKNKEDAYRTMAMYLISNRYFFEEIEAYFVDTETGEVFDNV